jgi:DHA1 family tetracycline resistance protein-like MFS transporter
MKAKNPLFIIFFTALIDMLGIGIVIPVLGHLFMDANGILPGEYALSFRTLMLGILISVYPLAQFFGAPILGALSDRYGRKKILMISLFGTFIGYVLFAYGILTRNITLLFASRILDGFTGGNISTIMSAIADVSKHEEKAKNFGLIGMAFGLGIIFGPVIGGFLADNTIVSWFNPSIPFFFAALLSLINFALVIFNFDETLKTVSHTAVSLLTGFKNIAKAMSMQNVRTMFIVVFLITFGFNFYTQFFQVYLIEKFTFTQVQIGSLFGYMGIWIALTQGFVTRALSKVIKPETVIKFSILMLAISVSLQLFPKVPFYFYVIIPFIALSNGITFPNTTAIISNLAGKESQGEILGINQSIQSLAMAVPPIIAGIISGIFIGLPLIVAGISIAAAWIVFITMYSKKKELFHEV